MPDRLAQDAQRRLTEIMERASRALVAMDYLACEQGCLEALKLAREARLWSTYARILNPLQESRRFRRQTALDGPVRLGGDQTTLTTSDATCLAIQASGDAVHEFVLASHERGRYVEVLCIEVQDGSQDATWTVHAMSDGPAVSVCVPAPPEAWQGADLAPSVRSEQPVGTHRFTRPADWFVHASEQLGDAAIAQVTQPLGSPERVDALEARLRVVADHEKLHQALAAAASSL